MKYVGDHNNPLNKLASNFFNNITDNVHIE